jgi:uncharacterized membrane protein YuzA (DUF378 family)
MKALHMISFMLLVIGGLNWLLIGAIGWDASDLIGGQSAIVSRVAFVLVGLSAVVLMATHKKDCKTCTMGKEHTPMV